MIKQPFHGCKAAVFVGDRLLTILRDDDPTILYPNMWDFPGGGREGDETPIETVTREIREELGLSIPETAFVWMRPYPAAFDPAYRVWFFVARLAVGSEAHVTFGDEGQKWALMHPEDFFARENAMQSYRVRLNDWGGLDG